MCVKTVKILIQTLGLIFSLYFSTSWDKGKKENCTTNYEAVNRETLVVSFLSHKLPCHGPKILFCLIFCSSIFSFTHFFQSFITYSNPPDSHFYSDSTNINNIRLHMPMEIHVLGWDRHKKLTDLSCQYSTW
jgi:hypothetical protein